MQTPTPLCMLSYLDLFQLPGQHCDNFFSKGPMLEVHENQEFNLSCTVQFPAHVGSTLSIAMLVCI